MMTAAASGEESASYSSTAVCRICHSGEGSVPYDGREGGEPLISPCRCKGTMGLVHRSCVERWLVASGTSCCEICKFRYRLEFSYPSVLESITKGEFGEGRKHLMADFVCLLCLTPIVIACDKFCYDIMEEGTQGFTKLYVDAIVPVLLSATLSMTYFLWVVFTVKFHKRFCMEWRIDHRSLRVIDQLSEEESMLVNSRRSKSLAERRLDAFDRDRALPPTPDMELGTRRTPVSPDHQQERFIEVTDRIDSGAIDAYATAASTAEVSAERARNEDETDIISDPVSSPVELLSGSCTLPVSHISGSAHFMASTPLASKSSARVSLFSFSPPDGTTNYFSPLSVIGTDTTRASEQSRFRSDTSRTVL